jgi:hypothetical protein
VWVGSLIFVITASSAYLKKSEANKNIGFRYFENISIKKLRVLGISKP